jgi:hypothetical protein
MNKVDPGVLEAGLLHSGAFRDVMTGLDGTVYAVHKATAYRVAWSKGTLSLTTYRAEQADPIIAEVKQAYTREAFRVAAKRAGFTVQVKADKLVATRARY